MGLHRFLMVMVSGVLIACGGSTDGDGQSATGGRGGAGASGAGGAGAGGASGSQGGAAGRPATGGGSAAGGSASGGSGLGAGGDASMGDAAAGSRAGGAGSAGAGGKGGGSGAGGSGFADASPDARSGDGGAGGGDAGAAVYRGCLIVASIDRIFITKCDADRGLAFSLEMANPSAAASLGLRLPLPWGYQGGYVAPTSTCAARISPGTRASTVTGTVVATDDAGAQRGYPSHMDVDVTMTFAASDGGPPLTEHLVVDNLDVTGACVP